MHAPVPQSLIALIEDDWNIATTLRIGLEPFGYRIDHFSSAESFLADGEGREYGLLIVDVNLPQMDGISLCRKVRELDPAQPVIVLTARADEGTAVSSLLGGANDFVRKPFGLAELKIRVDRQFARARLPAPPRGTREFHGLVLDPGARQCRFDGKEIELTGTEFSILWLLVKSGGEVLSREKLMAELDPDGRAQDRVLDSHVSRIRQKLREAGVETVRIVSVYGVGYRAEGGGT